MARITLEVGEDVSKALEALSAEKSTSKAEVIRRALASYAYLDQNTSSETGTKVSITDKNDNVLKDVILP